MGKSLTPIITHIITGLDVGGAERALYTLLSNGLEGPFRNQIISLMGPGHYGPFIEQAGIPVSCLHMRAGRPSLAALVRLRSLVARPPVHLVQGWMAHGNLAATLIRTWIQPQAILAWNIRRSLEGLPAARLSNRVIARLSARLSRKPEAIIYNSERSLSQHAQAGYCSSSAVHLPNGFDTNLWAPDDAVRWAVRNEFGIPVSSRVLGFVGRGHADKDPATLFAAFEKLASIHKDVVLLAVGRDLERFSINNNRILLAGQRSDVSRLMKAFDLFCMTSRVEGFPNVVGEAMSTGVPCVVTDVGDARSIVRDAGWVVPPRNVDAIVNALNEALQMKPESLRRMAENSRIRIIDDFSVTSVVERYVSLYRRLLDGKA